MSDLRELLKEEYRKKQKAIVTPQSLMEMIEGLIDQTLAEALEAEIPTGIKFDPKELILRMIPDIAVSEIGWSDVRTVTDEQGQQQQVSGPQRTLLVQFLKNIEGDSLEAKIASLARFYEDGAQAYNADTTDRGALIAKTISYLVFYKTLTKVITNFNASSAGFSFESFLAALVNGEQIKANTGTIADYIDRSSGTAVPISLKLYKEKQLEVGGSYTDLVNDLVAPKFDHPLGNAMRYVACTKALGYGEGKEGNPLSQEGAIRFFQFDFTLDNVMDILLQTKKISKVCIMLPKQVVSQILNGKGGGALGISNIPEKGQIAGPEELEKIFVSAAKKLFQANPLAQAMSPEEFDKLLTDLSWAHDDSIFLSLKEPVTKEDVGVIRGKSKIGIRALKRLLQAGYDGEVVETLARLIAVANEEVITSQSATAAKDKRRQFLTTMEKGGEFFTPEESAKQYKMMGPQQKELALTHTWGYLRGGVHFSLNQTQSLKESEPTNTVFLGEIKVGTKYVAAAIEAVRQILNEEVLQIFQSLKVLSESLNSYFANGLADDTEATTAVDNAQNIQSKTREIQKK